MLFTRQQQPSSMPQVALFIHFFEKKCKKKQKQNENDGRPRRLSSKVVVLIYTRRVRMEMLYSSASNIARRCIMHGGRVSTPFMASVCLFHRPYDPLSLLLSCPRLSLESLTADRMLHTTSKGNRFVISRC